MDKKRASNFSRRRFPLAASSSDPSSLAWRSKTCSQPIPEIRVPIHLTTTVFLCFSLAFGCWLVPFLRVETPRTPSTQLVHHPFIPKRRERHPHTQRGERETRTRREQWARQRGRGTRESSETQEPRDPASLPYTLAVAGEIFSLDAAGARSGVLGFPETGAVISLRFLRRSRGHVRVHGADALPEWAGGGARGVL
jgi:hypothetical protein